MKQQLSKGHRWQPGESGNPAGRPVGARQKIAERLIADIADKWEQHGGSVLERLAKDEPAKFAQIAYGLLPREAFLTVEQRPPGNLDPSDWAVMLRVLDIIKASAPQGADAKPGEIFETIEEALRAHFAKPIAAQSVQPVCIDAE